MSPRTEASWKGVVAQTGEDATNFWKDTSMVELQKMMGVSWEKWYNWLNVAAKVITTPGSVFEPGCGPSYLADLVIDEYGCTFEGCDINEEFLQAGRDRLTEKGIADKANILSEDLYKYLDRNEGEVKFDWVIVTSLFGMFPEDESYRLLKRFWNLSSKGMSITTLNREKYDATFKKKRKNHLTSHDPQEMLDFLWALPGVKKIEPLIDIEDGNLNRKMAFYIWR
jgi:hypothetical protein